MEASVDILGSSAAIPTLHRSPSCQILSSGNVDVMLDCGEGSQMRLMEYGLKSARLSAIFITHLHGDHVFGLPGLLSSMALQGRTSDLFIVGPQGVKQYIDISFQVAKANPPFKITYIELDSNKLIEVNTEDISRNALGKSVGKTWAVQAVPLKHRVETYGYIFKGRQGMRHLIPEKYFKITDSYKYITALKKGENVITDSGKEIFYKDVTTAPELPCSYAYITDTSFLPALADVLQGISVLYHESTFLHEHVKKARKTLHTTAKEAGIIAQAAEVGSLLLGHFSARYHDVQILEDEASSQFAKSIAVEEGMKYIFKSNGVVETTSIKGS